MFFMKFSKSRSKTFTSSYNDEETISGDKIFADAVKIAIESGKISISLLQKRIGIGYGRAAKIIDRMQELGYISAPDGNKPSNVLITMEEYMRRISEGTLGDEYMKISQIHPKTLTSSYNDEETISGDKIFADAVKIAIESGKISISLLQKRIGIGYGRAAKIIDRMQELGYISAPDGNKPRNVLITMEEYMRRISEGSLGEE